MINRFVGEYDFLRNFHPSPITIPSFFLDPALIIPAATVEYYYQAQKAPNPIVYEKIITAKSPGYAKFLGRFCEIPESYDWDYRKYEVMEAALRAKFDISTLRQKLLETGNKQLIEGNYHNDKIWGFCLKTNQGENALGQMIMEIRDELQFAIDDDI